MLTTIHHSPKRSLSRPQLQESFWLIDLLKLLGSLLAVYVLANLLSVRFVVDGPSMQPKLETGQFLLVSRLDYLFGEIERGDILVFHLPQDSNRDLIKRVVGLPSEAVEFRDSLVYINGQLLEETYLTTTCDIRYCSDGFWQLGVDEYFVLGDNRNQSADSRYFGAIKREYIIGEAILRYWPFADFGWIAPDWSW